MRHAGVVATDQAGSGGSVTTFTSGCWARISTELSLLKRSTTMISIVTFRCAWSVSSKRGKYLAAVEITDDDTDGHARSLSPAGWEFFADFDVLKSDGNARAVSLHPVAMRWMPVLDRRPRSARRHAAAWYDR